MISVTEARNKIVKHCPAPTIKQVPLTEACGLVLAENIFAPFAVPHFNQSAMDGYAFAFNEWNKQSALNVIGEVQAGNTFSQKLEPSQALRIFTGAALPASADTVVSQEKVTLQNNTITIRDPQLSKGSNVRPAGSQSQKNEQVLSKGHLLTPASLALLAGFGIGAVPVFATPSVSIIATGKELLKPGEQLADGKVYESNSVSLIAALHQLGISPASIQMVDDNEAAIEGAIRNQLHSDLLILTGGVSVGDYDFVIAALEKCGVNKVFHKVKQKPGKPLFFGTFNKTLVFGLPGNPASALTCYYEYVAMVIGRFTQKEYFKKTEAWLANDCVKKQGLTFFLKGKIQEGVVAVLNDQESYKMNSFAIANCLIELDEGREYYKKSEKVSIRMIGS